MRTKKYINGKETYLVNNNTLEISNPFKEIFGKKICVDCEINLSNIIDGYDYHDFPGSVNLWLSEEDIKDLHEITEKILDKIRREEYD